MMLVALYGGRKAIVDDEDYDRVSSRKWYYHHLGYAAGSKSRFMHRFIMDAPKGMDVDHINGDRLDNRRGNLRICTRGENRRNGYKYSHNTSGYKGVTANGRKWRAQITFNNKVTCIGVYASREDAARAYNEKAKELFGEFANLNKGV